MSTFSPNLDLELVARGGDVGTWDTPTNSNWSIMDSVAGGIATISLNNSNVALNAAQFQSKGITFISTLTGNVLISFPSSFIKTYEIQNLCTGSSAFTITLGVTGGSGVDICAPPGEIVDVVNDGSNMKYKNLGRIGSYVDYAGSSMPNWITGSNPNPYLACTGQGFSSAVYPVLTVLLGGTTTPDRRGTVGANLDQGAGRLTIFGSFLQVGGDQSLQSHAHTGTTGGMSANDPHTHTMAAGNQVIVSGGGSQLLAGNLAPFNVGTPTINSQSVAHNHAFTTNTAGGGGSQNLQPTTVIGITMIRAG